MRKKHWLDSLMFWYLDKNIDKFPKRMIKLIAYQYTDARIRKKYWKKLGVELGENSFPGIGMCCAINDSVFVKIGKNVSIGPKVTFVADSCANNGNEINQYKYVNKITKSQNIYVSDEVWIGANVTILPGCKIGTHCVIGAGSVVTKDVEEYGVYVGVPAKKVGDIRDME